MTNTGTSPAAPAAASTALFLAADQRSVAAFIEQLFPAPRRFGVRLWDGTELPGAERPDITLVLRSPGALRRMFGLPLEVVMGRAYMRGDFDLEGDIRQIGPALAAARGAVRSAASLRDLARAWRALPRDPRDRARADHAVRLGADDHTPDWDRAGVRYHYDAGNDFFALFLDRRMVYSCAYFPTGTEDLDRAQEAKLEHVCRKLRLRPGERLLDVGCGWGALIIHAARHHGVHALGITLSEQQAELARRRIADAGLQDRVRVTLTHYRDLAAEPFDKVASVGMFEHVGQPRLPDYFQHIHGLLRPRGLFLNHGIGNHPPRLAPPLRSAARAMLQKALIGTGHFRRSYVFPNGDLVSVSAANLLAERAGFEVRDVENLREHYGRTLQFWAERLEARRADAVRLGGERTFRIWRLFMGIASWQFASGELAVYQSLLEKRADGPGTLPWSRADLYR